jgi:hypothetical protein
MLSFSLPVGSSAGPFGWPILPHGGGSSYNNYGWYMGSNSGAAFAPVGINYGEYMPQAGRIYGAAVNWAIASQTNIQYRIYAVNYGSLAAFLPIFPGMDITASGAIPAAVGGGVIVRSRGSNSVWLDPITFAAGDYIGIYIVPVGGIGGRGAQIKDPIEIEGTIYLRFDNTNEDRTGTEQTYPGTGEWQP